MNTPNDLSEVEILRRLVQMQTLELDKLKAEANPATPKSPKTRRPKNLPKAFKIRTKQGLVRWVCEYTWPRREGDTKRTRSRAYGATAAEAIEEIKRVMGGDRPQKKSGPVTIFTVADLIAAYVRAKTDETPDAWGPATVRARQCCIRKHILPHFGPESARDLTSTRVREIWQNMLADKIGKNKVARAVQLLASAFHWAMEETPPIVAVNPVPGGKKRPIAKDKERRIPTPEELDRFFDEVQDDPLLPMYEFIANTGARHGEALALCWEDFPPFSRTVHIGHSLLELPGRKFLRKGTKTKESNRHVELGPATVAVLERHRAVQAAKGFATPEHPIFCDDRGNWVRKVDVYRRSFDPALKRAGVGRFVPHALRHRASKMLIDAKVPVTVVAARMGHADATMIFKRYAKHQRDGEQQESAILLDRTTPRAAAGGGA